MGETQLRGLFPLSMSHLTALTTVEALLMTSTANEEVALSATLCGNWTKLRRLRLSSSGTSSPMGTFPTSIGLLKSLESLSVYSIPIAGDLPLEIGRLSNLRSIYVTSTNLEGAYPEALSKLPKLESLHLSYNSRLRMSVDSFFQPWPFLSSLYLSNNKLFGTLSSKIGLLSNLRAIFIDGNLLNGTIPSEIGLLKSTEVLYLNQNRYVAVVALR
jgi:Leucine-rich repeat (LRR) protein